MRAFFNDGPCLSASNVVIPNQSSSKSSYSNQLELPSNWGGTFGVILMPIRFSEWLVAAYASGSS